MLAGKLFEALIDFNSILVTIVDVTVDIRKTCDFVLLPVFFKFNCLALMLLIPSVKYQDHFGISRLHSVNNRETTKAIQLRVACCRINNVTQFSFEDLLCLN